MSFAGNLATVSLGDILQLVSTGRRSGALVTVRGRQKKQIFFRDGRIIYATSESAEEDRLGQLLVRHGRLTPEQLAEVLKVQKSRGKLLGEIVIERNYLERHELIDALRLQAEEIIYSLFAWGDGEFNFVENRTPPENMPEIDLDTMNVMMEGARRFDEWGRLREELPPPDYFLRMRTRPIMTAEDVTLSPEDLEILALVDGRRQVEEVLQLHPRGEYSAARALYNLLESELVEALPVHDGESGSPEEMARVYELVFKLYSHSLTRVYRQLTDLLGEGGEQVFRRAVERKMTPGLFEALTQGDSPAALEQFNKLVAGMPDSIRLHKVLSQAGDLLHDRLRLVYECLGKRTVGRLAESIQKDVAFLLAQKRDLADRYDIGSDFSNSLRVR